MDINLAKRLSSPEQEGVGFAKTLRSVADQGQRGEVPRLDPLSLSQRKEQLDRWARIARRLLQVPATLISLFDKELQFFATKNIRESDPRPEVLRSLHAFSRALVEAGLPLAVADAAGDPHLHQLPAPAGLKLAAYLAKPLTLADGRLIGLICAIDERPRTWSDEDDNALSDVAEAVISEAEPVVTLQGQTNYWAMFEILPQIAWLADAKGQYTYANPLFLEFFGLSMEQVIGHGWLQALHPEDRERTLAAWSEAVASAAKCDVEYRVRRNAEEPYRWLLARSAPLLGSDGQIDGWAGVGIDIDNRRRSEDAQRRLIEALGVAVYTTDTHGRLTFFNDAAAAFWGMRPKLGDARWCGSWRLYWPDGTPMPHESCPMAQVLKGRRLVRGTEAVAERPDGSRVPFIPYPTPLRNEAGMLIGALNVLVDISERKAAEAALAQSEARLRFALDAGKLAFWELDIATGNVTRAPFHDAIFGYGSLLPAWNYHSFVQHVLAEDRAELDRNYKAAVEGQTASSVELRIRRAGDGEVRWIEIFCQPHQSTQEQGAKLFGSLRDITGRKQAEASLRENEARLRSILETVPDAMVVIDEHGLIESFSSTAERLFGFTSGEAIGQNVCMLMPTPDRERHDDYLARYRRTGQRRVIGLGRVVVGRRKDGSTFPVQLAIGEVIANGRRIFTGFLSDLSARHAAEARLQDLRAELLHVSRLSAAGEIASTLAHELNQPLTAAASAVGAAQRMLATLDRNLPGQIHEAMALIADQVLWAGKILRRLREFVSRGEDDRQVEDMVPLVEEAVALALIGSRESGLHATFHPAPSLRPVMVNRIQIQQVLFNLVRNAVEAMGNEVLDGDTSSYQELTVSVASGDNEVIEVSVADTGPGLSPEIASRLFESFVSTKPGGMGMGLSICRSIVESHGGRLWVEPRCGGGTIFRFTLPTIGEDAADGQARGR